MRFLWACTGSVATVKVPLGVALLRERGHEVSVVATEHGNTMLTKGPAERYTKQPEVFGALGAVLSDQDEWPSDYTVGRDSVLHIELRKWADVLVVAPMSANTMAKLANGMCDNLLTSVFRCWDFANKPVFLCPAMNTMMWDNPFTARHLRALGEIPNVHVIPPISKTLACRDVGVGAMEEVEEIVRIVLDKAGGGDASSAKRVKTCPEDGGDEEGG